VADAIGGRAAGQVIKGNERYDIYVRLADEYRNNVEAIRSLILQAPNGAWVKLHDVAQVEIESGPPQIRRDDVQRRVVIQTNVEGRDMGGLVAELQQRISDEVEMPPGYTVVFGGQFENQQRAQARLMIVVPLSLGLIFQLLYFAFNSIGQALLIMLNVPLALIGGIAALATGVDDRLHCGTGPDTDVIVQWCGFGSTTAAGNCRCRWPVFVDLADAVRRALVIPDVFRW